MDETNVDFGRVSEMRRSEISEVEVEAPAQPLRPSMIRKY